MTKLLFREVLVDADGDVHDLAAIYDQINAEHFKNKVDVSIRWGAKVPSRNRKKIALGYYQDDQALIVIHRALDQDWIPDFFISFIVFHEMLHVACPFVMQGERRVFHHREFRLREASHPDYDRALAWERQNLERLLRS